MPRLPGVSLKGPAAHLAGTVKHPNRREAFARWCPLSAPDRAPELGLSVVDAKDHVLTSCTSGEAPKAVVPSRTRRSDPVTLRRLAGVPAKVRLRVLRGRERGLQRSADLDTGRVRGYPYANGGYGNGRLWRRTQAVRPRQRGAHGSGQGCSKALCQRL